MVGNANGMAGFMFVRLKSRECPKYNYTDIMCVCVSNFITKAQDSKHMHIFFDLK